MNRFNFEDVYGVPFGTAGNIIRYPAGSDNAFELVFTTGAEHTESNVGFFMSYMGWLFGGKPLMELYSGDGELLYTADPNTPWNFSFFVNETGVDPLKDLPTGHPGVTPDAARDTWLKPGQEYVLRVERFTPVRGQQPIRLGYKGTDDYELLLAEDPALADIIERLARIELLLQSAT